MINKQLGTIMVFDQEYFESILPVRRKSNALLWKRKFYQGEHVYLIKFDDPSDVRILVRSSVDRSGFARGKGHDSIRVYLVHGEDPAAVVSGKISKFVTRKPGWERRMYAQFSLFRSWRKKAGDCMVCGLPRRIFVTKSKTSRYFGKVCATCCGPDDFIVVAEKVSGK